MYRWDGGFIMLDSDQFDEGVQWYEEVFGWKCMDKITTWVGRKAFMKLPRSGMVTIKSFEGKYEHFLSTEHEGNVRLVFVTYDLEKTLSYLMKRNIQSTEIQKLPNGQSYCDIFAFYQTRLTIVEEQRLDDNQGYPPSGILGFGHVNTIIPVTDPKLSAEWYKKHLGFELVEVNEEFAHMRTEDAYDRNVLGEQFWDHIWLIKNTDKQVEKPNDNKARTYYDIRPDEFTLKYNQLIQNGIKPSEVAGDPHNGWGGFHFYDPDNNRIDVWSYQMN